MNLSTQVIKNYLSQLKSVQKSNACREIKVAIDTEVNAKHFNTFFIKIGPRLAKKIETPVKTFEAYLKKCKTIQPENPLTVNELKDAFFFLFKPIKVLVTMELVLTLSRLYFGALYISLLNIFNLSLEKRIFPDDLKTGRVTPIFKTGDENDFGSYRPISFLPCLSKMLERIM